MGKSIEVEQGNQFTQALVRSAQRIDELATANNAGHFLLGLTPETIGLYSDRLKTYLGTVIDVLSSKQISEMVIGVRGDGIKAFQRRFGEDVDYGNVEAQIILRNGDEKARLLICVKTRHNARSRQKLTDFINHFPNTQAAQWEIREGFDDVAEKELTPEDLIPKEETRFNRNILLETFVVGLDTRLHAAKSESAYLETGETTDRGLRQRITALDQANTILKQVIVEK